MKEFECPKDKSQILWISESDRYDVMLSGWARIGTHRYYLLVTDFAKPGKEYWTVYHIKNRQHKAKRLKRTLNFRHMVGWHCEHSFGKPHQFGNFDAKRKPNWRDFYKL